MKALADEACRSTKATLKRLLLTGAAFVPLRGNGSLYCPKVPNKAEGGPGRFLWNLSEALRDRELRLEARFLSRAGAALFLSGSPGDAFLAICRRKGIRTVLRTDGFYVPWVFDGQEHPYRAKRSLDKVKRHVNERMHRDLKLCDRVVYQSRFCKEMTDQHLHRRDADYEIIYNGVDLERFRPASMAEPELLRVLMLGTWRDTDLLEASLETFRFVGSEIEAELTLVGPMTPGVANGYESWTVRHPDAAARIRRVDRAALGELPGLIAGHGAALHLKSGDWCPNAVLETMACGVPVVCQSWGGAAELVGANGLIVEADPFRYDPEFSKRAAAMLVDAFWANELLERGREARTRAERRFGIEAMVDAYLDVLLD